MPVVTSQIVLFTKSQIMSNWKKKKYFCYFQSKVIKAFLCYYFIINLITRKITFIMNKESRVAVVNFQFFQSIY